MFIELDPPSRAISFPKFYVPSVNEIDGKYMFLRNDGNGVDDGSGKFKLYLFDTKLEAHHVAMKFYHANCQAYTHIEEFLALQQLADGTNNTNDGDSQVMEFI